MAALHIITNDKKILLVRDDLTDSDLKELDYEGCKAMAMEWAKKNGHSYMSFLQEWDVPEVWEDEEGIINVELSDDLLDAIPLTH